MARRGFLARLLALAAGGALLAKHGAARASAPTPRTLAAEPFIGEIMLFAGNFAPRGWAFCDGQLLPISQNIALFSLLGTTYGGNGQSTFALPDLRGRTPIHAGWGPGLSNRILGENGGEEAHTLSVGELPAHAHPAFADPANGTSDAPGNLLPSRNPAGIPVYGNAGAAQLAPNAIGNTGGNSPHNIMAPYLALNYCIAVEGVFPSQS